MKLNIKVFNISIWITLILTYILPAQSKDSSLSSYGYPFAYLTIPNSLNGGTLLSSFGVNLLYLLLNIMVVYFIISIYRKVFNKDKAKEN